MLIIFIRHHFLCVHQQKLVHCKCIYKRIGLFLELPSPTPPRVASSNIVFNFKIKAQVIVFCKVLQIPLIAYWTKCKKKIKPMVNGCNCTCLWFIKTRHLFTTIMTTFFLCLFCATVYYLTPYVYLTCFVRFYILWNRNQSIHRLYATFLLT